MVKKILIALAAVVALFVVVVALQPTDFTISRSAAIAAPPARVFGIVNNVRRWNEWSPWAKLDPAMKSSYEGPAAGVGAAQSWSGNDKVGAGKMTLVESRPNALVAFRLEFLRPMQSTATVEFAFSPEGRGTAVTWSMSGKRKFVEKAFCLFVSMDKMVGGDFERGLAALKTLAEARRK